MASTRRPPAHRPSPLRSATPASQAPSRVSSRNSSPPSNQTWREDYDNIPFLDHNQINLVVAVSISAPPLQKYDYSPLASHRTPAVPPCYRRGDEASSDLLLDQGTELKVNVFLVE
ncbi:hypothetical protein DFH07DRAFT_1033845 [Mycena maculata]|uniref:Uncharacterized protein n=1 Tax=Mycena maculata TaxID=230809 RepID=A0AAD7N931_9AGAR|nr:hypothetical protein DFH07DRAFT_1033845 [Mycena maculata]